MPKIPDEISQLIWVLQTSKYLGDFAKILWPPQKTWNFIVLINLIFKVIGTSGDNKEYLWTMERNLDMDTQYQAKLKQDYNN